MIAIWNRKEVYVGNSMRKCNEFLDILDENKIKYKYKIVDNLGSNTNRMGTFGINMKYSKMYYVYVHEKDYDEVMAVLKIN